MAVKAFDLGHAFSHARMFDDITRESLSHRYPYYLIVCQVNSAFACELYLKCLLYLKATPSRGHDLWKLFQNLPKDKRDILEEIYKTSERYEMVYSDEDLDKITLDYLLKACGEHTYSKLRYEYENKNDLSPTHHRILISANAALKERLCQLRPEFRKHLEYKDIHGVYIINN